MKRIQKKYEIYTTSEYDEWFSSETSRSQFQIESRLAKIKLEGYFGDHKEVRTVIWELKWINGRRIYYAFIKELNILLLLGGNKNGQSKDINKAEKIFKKYRKT